MVWKNSKITKKEAKSRDLPGTYQIVYPYSDKTHNVLSHIPLYSKDYVMTKDDLADYRFKPSFLERMQSNVRLTKKKKKESQIIDGLRLRSHTLYTPSNFSKQKVFNGYSLFTSKVTGEFQGAYLQSKMYRRQQSLIGRFESKSFRIKQHRIFQYEDTHTKFVRHFNYRGLLFRSFWFSKFISTLVVNGKKQLVWKKILQVFSELKFEFGRNPVMLLFEILELYRMPLRALQPKNKTKKSIVRTHIISWWKQYTQLLRWIRHSVKSPRKTTFHWEHRIKSEIASLVLEDSNSLIKKRLELNAQMIAFSRVSLHFRWYKRYSRRAVRAVRVMDNRFYEGEEDLE